MNFPCLLEERSGKDTKMWTNPREDHGSPTYALEPYCLTHLRPLAIAQFLLNWQNFLNKLPILSLYVFIPIFGGWG